MAVLGCFDAGEVAEGFVGAIDIHDAPGYDTHEDEKCISDYLTRLFWVFYRKEGYESDLIPKVSKFYTHKTPTLIRWGQQWTRTPGNCGCQTGNMTLQLAQWLTKNTSLPAQHIINIQDHLRIFHRSGVLFCLHL